ncbi:sterol desaturase family protein [Pseudoflavitalea rhizosphaerae]|uniref:sterol desaturase family protein n=1 Tax=Pseudoflavitalea rhizosphaerae TaxID=1884793 RepID=UPI001F495037|nr:sterol desaturase family protein [Pseudoflavitalea rhizosphaerae]
MNKPTIFAAVEAIREQILILISTPVYLIIIGAEILLSNYRHRKAYTWKDTGVNVYLMLMNGALDLLFRGVYLVVLDYFYRHQVFNFDHVIVYWFMLVLLEDFLYYWLHRFDHEVRIFWAVHVTHHSSELFNFTVGFRSSVFQPLYRFIYFIPLALMGFSPLDIIFIYSATQIWGIFVHTEFIKKMGWLEHILVTPSHHRVHHASNPKYLDKNMGMFLIIWDKIFGTFQAELPEAEYQPIRYGLTTPLQKETPVTVVFHEWSSIWKDITRTDITWKEKWNYLFGPPGWSHDGSRLTSEEMRAEEDAQAGNSTVLR